jgi:hypothetical protein
MRKLIVALALAGLTLPAIVSAAPAPQEQKQEQKTEKKKKAPKKKKGAKTEEAKPQA